jgi:carbonic anhydrase
LKDLIGVRQFNDIPGALQNTTFGRLLAYHNLGHAFQHHDRPEMLIIMCMDYRESLRLPDNFAYVIRVAGARVRQRDFNVSFAIGVGGVSSVAVIGHTDCGMVNVGAKEEAFVGGLMERGGWDSETAHSHFSSSAEIYEIGSETESVIAGAERLRQIYKKIMAVPFVYRVEDRLLYLPARWKQ